MSNDNYVSALQSFDTGEYFEAPDVGTFNPGNAPFAAFALVTIRGAWQDATAGANPNTPQFIWGNFDTVGGAAGWGFQLTRALQVPQISAFAAGSVVNFALDSSGANAQWAERLMLLGLFYDGTQIYLTVNGTIVADPVALAAMVNSTFVARVGQNPNNAVDTAFDSGYVHGVGYTTAFLPEVPLPAPAPDNVGFLASAHFSACREDLNAGLFFKLNGSDWTHRYRVSDMALTAAQAAVLRNTTGSAVAQTALAPASWPDVGNQQFAPLPGLTPPVVTPTPLARVSAETPNSISLTSIKNPDWYQGGTFTFVPGT